MATLTGDQYVFDEEVTFIQYHLPGLEAGAYQLRVSQEVLDAQDQPLHEDTPLASTYTVAVRGDRFRLQTPSEIVFSTFPDDNASGRYDAVLPHVVFRKQTFPWSRHPQSGEAPASPPPGTPTWLAVLLLDEDDVAAFPALKLPPQQATMGDLFPPALYPDSTLGSNLSYFRHATDTSGLSLGDKLTDAIQVLDVPLPLLAQLAPSLDDLYFLAHGRRVSLVPKPTLPGISDVGEPVGDFSIVFGNRLPQAQKKSFAYLISLEEMGELLPGSASPAAAGDAATCVRLAVLQSWQFFSMGDSAAFDDRLLALNGRPAGSTTDAPLTTLRLVYTGTNPLVASALQMGYAPLDEILRTGESTVSWYRGPLVPYQVPEGGVRIPLASPDQALVFDPTTGLLDTSYAAAWSLGRLVALQDKGFSTALYAWKQKQANQVVQSVQAQMLNERFAALLSPPAAAQPLAATAEGEGSSAEPAGAPAFRFHLLQALLPTS